MTGVHLPHIAFIGRAGAGKTTCAELLVERFGYERVSFAAPLKAGCGTTDDRSLLQKVGHGVRELHEDFWVNLFLADVARREELGQFALASAGAPMLKFVVDDCRYPNEAAALRVAGFTLVRVAAPAAFRVQRLKSNGRLQDESQLQHVSETALDDFVADYWIANDGRPDDLAYELTSILNAVRS